MHQGRVDFRFRFAQMHVAGGYTVVKQRKPFPLPQFIHNIGCHIGQVKQPVSGFFQVPHGFYCCFFGAKHGSPLFDHCLHLKHAVDVCCILQHDSVPHGAGDGTTVQILPFLAAEGQIVDHFLRVLVHKAIHQKIAGVKVNHYTTEIKDHVFIHKTLPDGLQDFFLLYTQTGQETIAFSKHTINRYPPQRRCL